jgi:hypothetical protein
MPEGAWEWTKLVFYLSLLGFPFWAPLLYGIFKPSVPATVLTLVLGFVVLMFFTVGFASLGVETRGFEPNRFIAAVAAAYTAFAGLCVAAARLVHWRRRRRALLND